MDAPKFQTLSSFIQAPFGEPEIKSNEYERKYKELKSQKKIVPSGITTVEDNYFVHLKVGSESNSGEFYDVVIMFFTESSEIKLNMHLERYYVKFFSNSPSFIYQYAALYKKNGFLIDLLFDKMDAAYADKLPEKINQSHKMSYDKSIYCAAKFLLDNRMSGMIKTNYLFRKKNPDKFFQDIKDFENVKLTTELRSLDKKIDKELEANKRKKKEEKQEKKKVQKRSGGKTKASTTTQGFTPGVSKITRKSSKRKTSTFSANSNLSSIKTVKRKGGKKSTF